MRSRYLIYLLPVLFCCCKKSSSGTNNNNTVAPVTFTVLYDSVISCSPNGSCNFVFNMNILSGNIDNEFIYCYIKNIPANVSVSPDTIRVSQLFWYVFTISVGNSPIGTDTMQFMISSNTYGVQNHNFILKIIAPNLGFAGTYDSSFDFCAPNILNYVSVVSPVTDSPSEIKITNIQNLGSGFAVKAQITSIITIPLQTVDGYTIWGSGTYTLDNRPAYDTLYTMVINDTLVQGIDTQICTTHIRH
jgi:hypothetical protein